MALTGLKIQKYLPKTNCKECGSNTCLAFAMKLAAKKADLSDCPYASEEAKALLGAASEPPVRAIALGTGGSLKLGGETVFYRHEKTFVNQTALAVNIADDDPPEKIERTLTAVRDYLLERVGERLTIDMVALTNRQTAPAEFAGLVRRAAETAGRPLIIRSENTAALLAAAAAVKGTAAVLASATPANIQELQPAALENGHALAVTAPDLDQLIQLTTSLRAGGFNDLLLQFQTHSLAEQFQVNALARRAALKENFKPLGYPFLRFLKDDDSAGTMAAAVTEIAKFGGVCVLPEFDPAQLVALMTVRMNIFTDPQKPIQVEPGIYEIGDPGPEAPVFVTTNFSLTYFIISGEIENSGLSARLAVPECEGMSVLTSWAAGKFSGSSIAKFIRESGLEEKTTGRKLIIPGYVAQISGELEESLPGWSVIVGPQESADLDSFIANMK